MAIYNLQIKTISRGDGHSATAKIAYNTRSKIKDQRTGTIHYYNKKKMSDELLYSEIQHKNITFDNHHRSKIWNAAELADTRVNSRTAREFMVALPKELNLEQNKTLVRDFVNLLTCKYDHIAEWAIHNQKNDNGNFHAHILTTTRKFDPISMILGSKTDLELDNGKLIKDGKPVTQEQIKSIRKTWEDTLNNHLKKHKVDIVVSGAKKNDRTLVKKHLGKEAASLERRGIKTYLGDYNNKIDEIIKLQKTLDDKAQQIKRVKKELEDLDQIILQMSPEELSKPIEPSYLPYITLPQDIIKVNEKIEVLPKVLTLAPEPKFLQKINTFTDIQVIPPLLPKIGQIFTVQDDQKAKNKQYEDDYKKRLNEYHFQQQQEYIDYQNKLTKTRNTENEERNQKIQKRIMKQSEQEKQIPEFVVVGFNIKLFRIAIAYGDFFTKTKIGHDEVWISKNANISVHKDKISIRNLSEDDLKMMLDITLKKFGNSFYFIGDDKFISTAIDIMINDPKFDNVLLSNPEQQRRLINARFVKNLINHEGIDEELFSENLNRKQQISQEQNDDDYFNVYEHKVSQKKSNNSKQNISPKINLSNPNDYNSFHKKK